MSLTRTCESCGGHGFHQYRGHFGGKFSGPTCEGCDGRGVVSVIPGLIPEVLPGDQTAAQKCQFSDSSYLMDIGCDAEAIAEFVFDSKSFLACGNHTFVELNTDPRRFTSYRYLSKEKEKQMGGGMDRDRTYVAPISDDRRKRDPKAELLYEWTVKNDQTYRLIAIAKHTPGYRDTYVIDRLERDSLGEPSWKTIHTYDSKVTNEAITLMISAIESLLTESSIKAAQRLEEKSK